MNHESFLAAIRANPEDDATRLIYADWIDDQGDSNRAEFIRLQLRLACMDEDDPQKPLLEQRQRTLLEHHEQRWLGPIPAGILDWSFRGGFVERVVLRPGGSQTMIEEMFARHPIHETVLAATGHLTGLAGARWLAHVSALSFDRSVGAIDRSALRTLLHSPHLTSLCRLALCSQAINRDFPAIVEGSSIRSLRSLDVSNTSLYDADVTELLRLPQLAALDELSIEGGMVSPACFERLASRGSRWRGLGVLAACPLASIARLQGCSNLRKLALNISATQQARLPFLPALEEATITTVAARGSVDLLDPRTPWPAGLRRLSVWAPNLDSEPRCQALSALLEHLPEPVLELSVREIIDDRDQTWSKRIHSLDRIRKLEIGHLAEARGLYDGAGLTGLEELHVATRTSVRDEHLARAVASPDWRRLRVLRLNTSTLGAATVKALVESPHLTRLRDLRLCGPMSSDCLVMLANWPGLRSLDRLELTGEATAADSLQALLTSPHLSPLTHLCATRLRMTVDFRQAFRDRLGRRFHG